MTADRNFDFVIAGGGSAACVAAMRLVRDFGFSVLIVERGPRDTARLMSFPAGYMKYLARDDFLEMHHTVPQPQLGGRGPIVPVASALGGGSAVNAMVYMRGQKEDYDGWAAHLGNGSEWSYEDMLPHFKGIEANSRFNNRYHGISGNLRVSEPRHISDTTEDFILAAQGLGHPYNPDFNGARQNGVGIMQHTFASWGRRIERSDAKKAFLDPLGGDSRLKIVTRARVDRILIESGRAVGVVYTSNGESRRVLATREVLVAAGTYNSAKLMMLSGIGPADHLREHGIAVAADLPGVGANLQDHHEVPVIASTKSKSGYFGEDRGWPMIRNGLQYLLFNTGPVTTTGIESCLFYDPDGGDRPTIQLYCAPIVYLDRDVSSAKSTYGVTFTSCLLRPKARGSVKLRSPNPADQPLVDCNFFGDPDDLRLTLASLKTARRLLETEPFKGKIAEEILPGRSLQDEASLTKFAGQTVKTNYHPAGSLRMGPETDPMSVVDGRLRVRGVDGLRVIDCSIIPFIPSGNTNAPAMAIGSKAASMIAEDYQ
ncbi:GMC family oxidoreductase N-terminal domain-containing protein [Rhizobium bangladeshense]|uniref:GMC family oxidoreductase n=1 Tax=Rhizobium bangladeshense TaxID=1138189 RepID=UPI001A992DA7|nr:GMC family oxidoreductase N-terminal domain-containing protein [Rhizobium bangladeshense]MBX4890467.1 FAD-binding protein [Rhizobium bangladeshense]MBX4921231.1 FAD-binding protein [Rhizobium bangladeshense]MBX4933400.1 FAD-binding protein [Rhizobium bangladeshense]MBY3583109.1 GMC family oxidoreductase N-terminal domain-containing protein [Rhizobium bangladeshense]QSY88356.1 GMC family oxidoreductase N-terminal domain-containing protein [Rhizobium bangladeshense]